MTIKYLCHTELLVKHTHIVQVTPFILAFRNNFSRWIQMFPAVPVWSTWAIRWLPQKPENSKTHHRLMEIGAIRSHPWFREFFAAYYLDTMYTWSKRRDFPFFLSRFKRTGKKGEKLVIWYIWAYVCYFAFVVCTYLQHFTLSIGSAIVWNQVRKYNSNKAEREKRILIKKRNKAGEKLKICFFIFFAFGKLLFHFRTCWMDSWLDVWIFSILIYDRCVAKAMCI